MSALSPRMDDLVLDPSRWTEAAFDTADEVAQTVFATQVQRVDALEGHLARGSAIPIKIPGQGLVLLGVFVSDPSLRQLANSMYGLVPEDTSLHNEDMLDALGETANIMAGGIIGRLSSWTQGLAIGLPHHTEPRPISHYDISMDLGFDTWMARLVMTPQHVG